MSRIRRRVGVTNLVTNSSLETNTTGWSASSASLARVTTDAFHGVACCEVTTQGIASGGINAAVNITIAPSTYYTASFALKSPLGTTVRFRLSEVNAAIQSTATNSTPIVGTGAWQTFAIPCLSLADSERCSIQFLQHTAGDGVFLFQVDKVQFELGAYATSFVYTNGGSATRYYRKKVLRGRNGRHATSL